VYRSTITAKGRCGEFLVTYFSCYSASGLVLDRILRPWLYPDFIYYRTKRGKLFRKYVDTMNAFTSSVSIL
jgi:hypothetical protein